MRKSGRSEISSFCFFVWCESSSLLRLKFRSVRGVTLVLVLWGVGKLGTKKYVTLLQGGEMLAG